MFGQMGAWLTEADSVREGLEVREEGIWRYLEDCSIEFERSMIEVVTLTGLQWLAESASAFRI